MLGCQIYHRMITLNRHEMMEHCKVNVNENRIKLANSMLSAILCYEKCFRLYVSTKSSVSIY